VEFPLRELTHPNGVQVSHVRLSSMLLDVRFKNAAGGHTFHPLIYLNTNFRSSGICDSLDNSSAVPAAPHAGVQTAKPRYFSCVMCARIDGSNSRCGVSHTQDSSARCVSWLKAGTAIKLMSQMRSFKNKRFSSCSRASPSGLLL